MDEKRFKSGEDVITQGDKGDCLYFVESGNLECYKQFSKGEKPVLVKKYEPGDSFGELALLYNAPRAATIRAVSEEVITWVLDRETFNNIVRDAAQKKREKYENFLKNVEILSTIDSYELTQISDAIKSATYQKDDYIIREGEMGDIFYILEEGQCVATKTLEPGKPDTVIKEYGVGGYFGERALIKGEPRYANIIVKSDIARVISLDRTSFKRLLGPIEDLLKRNMEKYQTFVGNK
jgi:cAMP-dependent protein kinase regulator